MIVVRIELWPNGDNAQARNLGMATISNVAPIQTKGKPITQGIYKVKLYKAGQRLTPYMEGTIYNFRRRSYGAWYLLAGALNIILSQWKDAFDGEPDRPTIPLPRNNKRITSTPPYFSSPAQ